MNEELQNLRDEWEEYKKPIKEEIFETKQQISDKRVEFQYKADKIKELKKELKQAVQDIEHKKKVYAYMEQEWNTMPKDVNRNQYTKRISEIIHNLKIQNNEIKSILEEVHQIQDETHEMTKQIKKVDTELEDIVFKDAQKDKLAKDIYKEIMSLKGDFEVLISAI
jgi:chromosome segregation ATPase